MKVTLLPSSFTPGGSDDPFQFLTSYLIDDCVAIDAGSLGFYRGPEDQARVRHVFLSHAHIDHIASLPIFVENVFEGKAESVTVHASEEVLHSLRQDVFNDRIWPDFLRLSVQDAPFLKLTPLVPGRAVEVENLRITPVPVNHVVPTLGFLVEGPSATVVFPGDTGPTAEIWHRANAAPRLKAIFLEATFPNEMAWLAEVSGHLTPSLFRHELAKIQGTPASVAVHIKPRYFGTVIQELKALNLSNLQIGQSGRTYTF